MTNSPLRLLMKHIVAISMAANMVSVVMMVLPIDQPIRFYSLAAGGAFIMKSLYAHE